MMRAARQSVIVLAAILACALLVLAGGVDGFRQQQSTALFTQQNSQIMQADSGVTIVNRIRGGASDDSDDEETDDEEEEEEEAPTLVKSAKKAAKKAVKKEIKTAIAKPSKKSGFFKLPYILKACLNPIVFWQMTTGYWKSLFNIDYMAENVDPSQDLRTALEQKARYGPETKPKGRKKMKPGQAKTLSDLPALNT